MVKKILLMLVILTFSFIKAQAEDESMLWQYDYPNGQVYAMATYNEQYIAVFYRAIWNEGPDRMLQSERIELVDYNTKKHLADVFSSTPIPYSTSLIGNTHPSQMFFNKSGTQLYLYEEEHSTFDVLFKVFDVVIPGIPGGSYPKKEISMMVVVKGIFRLAYDVAVNTQPIFIQSLDKKYIACGVAYAWESYPNEDSSGIDGGIRVLNTEDNTFIDISSAEKDKIAVNGTGISDRSLGTNYLAFSPSGNYIVFNRIEKRTNKGTKYYKHCNFYSLDQSLPSYYFNDNCLKCIISADDNSVLSNAGVFDLSRTHKIKAITTGDDRSFFLPDNNHVFFTGAGRIKDTKILRLSDNTESVGYKVALSEEGEKFVGLQVSASGSKFTTISLWDDVKAPTYYMSAWEIPTNLSTVKFKSGFAIPTKKTYSVGEKVEFSNMTFPFRRNVKYEWNFGDGNTSTDIHPSHAYTQAGTYQVKLVSNDETGGKKDGASPLGSSEATGEIDSVTQTIVIAATGVEEWTAGQELNTISATPNPFSEGTTIHFRLNTRSRVDFKITNMLGEEIDHKTEVFQASGEHSFEWNGLTYTNTQIPAGVYYCTISTGDFTKTVPIVLAR